VNWRSQFLASYDAEHLQGCFALSIQSVIQLTFMKQMSFQKFFEGADGLSSLCQTDCSRFWATQEAQSPSVACLDAGSLRTSGVIGEHSLCRAGSLDSRMIWSDKYFGAMWCKHLYTRRQLKLYSFLNFKPVDSWSCKVGEMRSNLLTRHTRRAAAFIAICRCLTSLKYASK